MAGRTLHQAMAYLGLAEEEPQRSPERTDRAAASYREDRYENYDDTRDVFEYHEREDDRHEDEVTPDAGYRELSSFFDERDRERESEPLAPIIETERARPSRGSSVSVRDDEPASSLTLIHSDSDDESEEVLRRITTIHPRSYNDAKIIGESFRENIPVIMNVTDMGESEAKRLVDFSAGLAFALHGSIERVTDKVFLLTPANLEVLGAEGAEVPVALDSDSSDLFNQG